MKERRKEIVELVRTVTEKKGYSVEEILEAENLQDGLLDSLELVQLVIRLEEYFSISISDEYLDLSRFSNIDSITKLVDDIMSDL